MMARMDLDHLQSETRRLMEGLEHPRVGAALALGEECGELLRCVLEREVYGAAPDDALVGEVGDVLLCVAEICERYGLSLDACAAAALARLERRVPGWRETLGDNLRAVRERLDG